MNTSTSSTLSNTKPADISVKVGGFSSTSVTVSAVSDKAITLFSSFFGEGAVSAELRKSFFGDFVVFARRHGLVVA